MATQDYITLENPGAFNPGNDVTFRIRYSPNHCMQYATLVVYGYKITVNGTVYTGGKFTVWASELQNGEGLQEITVPGGTLAPDATLTDSYGCEGIAYAYVVFGTAGMNEPLINGNVDNTGSNPRSNEIVLSMSMYSNADFVFQYTQQDGSYLASGSTLKVWMHIKWRKSAGKANDDTLKSYKVLLYDSNQNIVFDSGMKKDWLFPTYYVHSYKIKNLKDNTVYYVSAQAIMNSGAIMRIPKTQVNVHYVELPEKSQRITLNKTTTGINGIVNLSELEYTKVEIRRTTANEGVSLTLKSVDYPPSIYTFVDNYMIPKKTYIYSIVVYNGSSIVTTIQTYIDYTNNYVVIADIFGAYAAIGNITKYPVSRNDRGQEVIVMDGQYPYFLINGDANYENGSVDAVFGELEDCELQTDNAEYSKALREWLNNGYPKFLTYYNGESWIVGVSGVQTTDPNNTDTLNTSFNWVQIGEGEEVDTYAEMGLIENG